ncbi:MAG: TIM barrel protein [Phycisphaera sp.]|nr:TIM barrel protein [Phycisphaera sp.]
MIEHPVYIATVCLERNRWGSKQPSFKVSDWLDRFKTDGFDGIELWENHYLLADESERQTLAKRAWPVAVYNTYTGFTDDEADTANRSAAAEAIHKLEAHGVKYNIGRDKARLDEYRKNLLEWSRQLPAVTRLLCECHGGTAVEKVEDASAFFNDLDPERFGVIVHLTGDCPEIEKWLTALGDRLAHLHIQQRLPEHATPEGQRRLADCVGVLKEHGYTGSAAVEFTRGIGKDEQLENLYAHALDDLKAYREAWK